MDFDVSRGTFLLMNSKRPLIKRSLSLWMWGVKEKDMGGFRHYIKTPFVLLSGDNTVILPIKSIYHLRLLLEEKGDRLRWMRWKLIITPHPPRFSAPSPQGEGKLIRYRFNIIKLWNTHYVFNIFVCFGFNRICINSCTTDCINRIVKSIYKNSDIFEAT